MKFIIKLRNIYNNHGIHFLLSKSFRYLKIKVNKIIPTFMLFLTKNYIIINWSDDSDNLLNFGDALNPYITNKLSNKKVISYSKIFNIKYEVVFSVIGSVLNNLNVNNIEIWGSGFISKDGMFKIPPKKIHAVRGPLTRGIILKQGIECPKVYGDPALLLPFFYKPIIKKQYKLGVIPHYIDKYDENLHNFIDKFGHEVIIIDIEQDIHKVVDNINSCEKIASSSLHGIIVADAYNIPSLWVKFSEKICGGDFKYLDYMHSVKKSQLQPFNFEKDTNLESILSAIYYEKIEIDLKVLIESCPFIDNEIKNNLIFKLD